MKVIILDGQAIATHEDAQLLYDGAYPVGHTVYYVPNNISVLGSPAEFDEEGNEISPAIPPKTEAEIQAVAVDPPVVASDVQASLTALLDDIGDYRIQVEARLDAIELRLNALEAAP